MIIWANRGEIIMMIRLLKDWLNWKHNFGSCCKSSVFLIAIVSFILTGVHCQPQQHMQNQHQNLTQFMPKVSHELKNRSNDSATGSRDAVVGGYFLLQKSARSMQLQPEIKQSHNEYDGSANLDFSNARVDAKLPDNSSKRSWPDFDINFRQFRDIPQRVNVRNANQDNGQDFFSGIYDDGIRTKNKRSIGVDNGLGPIRVFKYITEDQALQSIPPTGDNSVGVDINPGDNDKKSDIHFKKSHPKDEKTKAKTWYNTDPMKSSTVTDRSLIPNSYFGSESESQKHNQTDNQAQDDIKPEAPAATNLNLTTNANANANAYISAPIPDKIRMPNFQNTTKYNGGFNRQRNSPHKPSAKTHKEIRRKKLKEKLANRKRANAEFLLFNASLSERPRRSPFRNANYQPFIYQQRLIQQQQYQQHQQQQQRLSQLQQSNRGAMYLPNGMSPNAMQMQRFSQIPQNLGKVQMQYPNLQIAMPPQKTPQDIQPSSSNDYFNYRPLPPGLPYNVNPLDASIQEPSWNHPMYRRYSKVAKRVQNQVSGVLGNAFSSGHGSSHSRRDRPKSKPIPLPRPKPSNSKGRRARPPRPRERERNNPINGNIRYSYPKSAQSIQDILNHFQHDNNEILDSVAKPSKSSPSAGGRGGGSGSSSGLGGGFGGPGPGSIADLSSELKDVRFSLLRDIREFAKRPNDMSRDAESSSPQHSRNHNSKSSNRYQDEPSPKRAPFYSEDHMKSVYQKQHASIEHDGFDEMSDPKPKPVRAMVKKTSSRFRDEEFDRDRDRDSSSSREKESQHSKKRDRPPSHYRDRESTKDFDPDDHPPKYSKPGPKYYDDSTERYREDRERYKNDRPIRHHNSGERPRDHRDRHRDQPYRNRERPKRPRNKFSHRDNDDFNSFESRNSGPYYRPKDSEANNRLREVMEYPKSIRDKIHEVSGELDQMPNPLARDPSQLYRATNKPIVIKRPYEPYRIPPALMNTNFDIPKKSSEQDFWSTYASATEKNLYVPSYIARPTRPKPPPPLILSSPTGGYTPRYVDTTNYNNPTPSISPDEDIVEIHTGGPPPLTLQDRDRLQEKSLQKAYMELLQHKMQAESALLNPPRGPTQSSPSNGHPAKSKKTPMRMKIHIYPNTEPASETGGTEMTSHNFNTFGNQMNYGGSSYSESHPSNMLSIAPRDSQKIGGSLRSPQRNMHPGSGPAPPTQMGYGNGKSSLTSSDKNKNLVLHLHVHRRNDGPVELDAEASELQTSTVKPLTYKNIFDGHQQQQEDQQAAGGDQEPDKSVSMEVPIHDDKIEDVLHTLLQFRDREGSRKKRNHVTEVT